MGKFDTDRSAVDEMLDDNESNNSESLATKATDKAKSELKDKAGKELKKKVTKEAGKKVASGVAKKSMLAALAPYLTIAAAVILAIIIAVGIATFLVTMPGMVMGSIRDAAKGWVEGLLSALGLDSTAMIDDEDINPVLDSLESMGYDIKGYGFLTEYATSSDTSGGSYLDTDTGVVRYSEDSGEHTEDSIKKAYSDFVFTYLMSDNYMYTVKNFNLDTQNGDHWYNKLFAVITGYYVRLFELFTGCHYFSEAWGKGLIAIYHENGFGVKGSFYQDSLFSDIDINPDKKTMTIKRAFGKKIEYNLDGWTGRYGVPLEFLISIHMGTMMPDLAYSLATSFPTEVIMLLHSTGDNTYIPYISKVENHWYRDVYFVNEDKPFIQVDEEYEDVMKERWTLYETHEEGKLRGEYKLYAINSSGDYATDTSQIRNYSNASSKFVHENGMYLFNGTMDEASEYGLDVAKKAVTNTYTDEMYENIEWNNINGVWTAYELNGDTIKQTGEAMRGETNAVIKKLFLYNTYFRYDGSQDTAEAITKLRKDNNIEYGALDLKYDLSQNNDALEDVKTTIEGEDGSTKTYSLKDVSGKVVFNQDSLNAFSMLENTNTVDADYIYRDFKELAVELGYFGKSELADETPTLMAWPVPDTGSYKYPYRTIDKRENEFGTMIHSKGDLDACKAKEFEELVSMVGSEIDPSTPIPSDVPRGTDPSTASGEFGPSEGENDPSSVTLDEFVETARKMAEYINEVGYDYCVCDPARCHHDTHHNGHYLARNFVGSQDSIPHHNMCCATFVSWALQNVKVMADSDHIDAANGLITWIEKNLPCDIIHPGDQLMPGDIFCYNEHIDMVGRELDDGFEKYNGGHLTKIGAQPYGEDSAITKISGWPENAYAALRIRWNGNDGKPYVGYNGNEAVVSPVTGILLEYGTYGDSEAEKEERTNVDMKYGLPYVVTSKSGEERQTVIDKVGYAKILVLDAEYYKKLEMKTGSHWANDSLVNESVSTNATKRLLEEPSLKSKDDLDDGMWTNLNKTVYGYKEFAEKYEIGGIAGNIIYIDGFICQDVDEDIDDLTEEIPSGDPISISDFDVSVDDEDNQRKSLYEKEKKRRFIQKDYTDKVEAENEIKKDAASSLKITDNGKDLIFIKEGTVLGRTMTDKELLEAGYLRGGAYGSYNDIRDTDSYEEAKVIGNYLRMIFRDKDDTVIENVEDYLILDEPDEIKRPIDLLTDDYPMDQKVRIIMDYLMQEQHFTMGAAAGLVGNMMQESRISGNCDNGLRQLWSLSMEF